MESKEPTSLYFDILSGKHLIGEGAYYQHIEAGNHPMDIYRLGQVLVDPNIPLPQNESVAVRGSLDREAAISNGRFVLNTVQRYDPNKGLTVKLLEKAWDIGALEYSPSQLRSNQDFRTIIEFQEAVGQENLHRKSHFDKMTLGDLVTHIAEVAKEEGRKPTLNSLVQRSRDGKLEPSPHIIRRLIKQTNPALTFYDLYDLAGLAESTHSWSNERYELWGQDYMWANRGRIPSANALRSASRKRVGPSERGVFTRYGSISNYQQKISDRFEKLWAKYLDELEGGLVGETLPGALMGRTKSEWVILKRYIGYKLIDNALPSLDKSRKFEMSRLLGDGKDTKFESAYPKVNLNGIKADARAQGIYGAVWPRQSRLYRREKRKSTVQTIDPSTNDIAGLMQRVDAIREEEEGFPPGFLKRIRDLEEILSNPPAHVLPPPPAKRFIRVVR